MADNDEAYYLKRLHNLGIHYNVIHHEPVWHMSDRIPGAQMTVVKNLLVKCRANDEFYLCLQDQRPLDFKLLAQALGVSRSSLELASALDLAEELAVVPGMVSALTLQPNDHLHVFINPVFQGIQDLGFHLGSNTATAVIRYGDLIQFLKSLDFEPEIIDLSRN